MSISYAVSILPAWARLRITLMVSAAAALSPARIAHLVSSDGAGEVLIVCTNDHLSKVCVYPLHIIQGEA